MIQTTIKKNKDLGEPEYSLHILPDIFFKDTREGVRHLYLVWLVLAISFKVKDLDKSKKRGFRQRRVYLQRNTVLVVGEDGNGRQRPEKRVNRKVFSVTFDAFKEYRLLPYLYLAHRYEEYSANSQLKLCFGWNILGVELSTALVDMAHCGVPLSSCALHYPRAFLSLLLGILRKEPNPETEGI